MTTISTSTRVAAPPRKVFDYVGDRANAMTLVEGLTKFEALDRRKGKGARIAAEFKFGPATFEATLVVTEWALGKRISWESESGLSQSLSWSFEKDGDGTLVEFAVGFEPPGGVAGAMFSVTVEPTLRARAKTTLATLKREVERRQEGQASRRR